MAFVYQRKDSDYYYIGLSKREQIFLARKSFSTKLKNKKAAQHELKIINNKIKDIRQRSKINKTKTVEYKLTDLYDKFKTDRKNTGNELSPGTIENYDKAFKYFYSVLPDKNVPEYNREDYNTFVSSMDEISQNSRSIYTHSVYALFRWMVLEEYINKNPMKRVSEETIEFTVLTRKEISRILTFAKTTKYYYLIKFMILSGFRQQEAAAFKLTDVKKNYIRVHGKGNKFARIPLTNEMNIFLDSLPDPDASGDPLWPFSKHQLYRFWKRVEKETGIKATSHDLRKYCLSELANSGVSINFTKTYARHSDIKTTLKYYIETDLKKMSEQINERVNFNLL